MSQAETIVATRTKNAVKEPSLYRVIYINDNTTTMEFVVETLIEFFGYTEETAAQITVDSGLGLYTYILPAQSK